MANLSNCLKIHFGDKGDEFVANMVKDQANKIAGQGRVSQDIARQAVHNVIADFKADSAGIEQQIRSLISNIPKEGTHKPVTVSQGKEAKPVSGYYPISEGKKEPKPISGVNVTYNQAKNGIEVSFDTKADAQTIQQLKNKGFKWSSRYGLWYAKDSTDRRSFVERIGADTEEVASSVSPIIPLTNEVEELKITTGSVLEEQEGGVENVIRPGAPEGPVRDDRAGIKGPGPEDLSGVEKGGETPGISEKPRREHDGKLSGSVRGSLDADNEETTGRPKNGTGIEHESQRDVAPDHGNVAGLQRPDAHDYRITPGSLARVGSWEETASRNLDIIQLVKKLEAENRLATPEEQALLVKYVGWGASDIRNKLFSGYRAAEGVLDSKNYYGDASWKPIIEKASTLLTKEEVQTAARSSQYAHYTNEPVIRSIWNGIKRMGFPGGRIFEPGMGTGNFAGLMPDDIYSKSSYTGIEFDHLTAGVAKQLYQKQNILLGDFTKQTFPNNFFDLSIGNPPFSRTKILADPDYKKYGFAMHNYFFAKSIDKTKPGGLLVFVTSHYTMDARESKIRKYLAERDDLVGAIRLPQTAFKESAGTEVVTDILFLRKRAQGEEAGGYPWANTVEVPVEGGETKLVNEYFGSHPDMVLGTHSSQGTMYGKNEYTVLPKEGNIEDHFTRAIEQLPENIYSITKKTAEEQKEVVVDRDWDPKNKKEGGLYLSDKGELMRVSFGSGVPLSSEVKLTPRDDAWLKDYVPLRDLYKKSRHDQFMDGEWEKSLADLNKAYDQFVKKHGNIAEYTVTEKTEVDDEGNKTVTPYYKFKNEKLALLDVEGPLVLALEKVSEDGEISKRAFFSERTIKKPERGEIKSLGDAMAISLDDKGKLDLGHIAELLGRPKETMAEEMGDLVYENPAGTWEMSDEYLSGDVVSKLEEAEAAAKTDQKYQRNVEALAAVQPKPLTPKNITVKLGAPWIDPKYIADFARDVLKLNANISYHAGANRWGVGLSTESGRSWNSKQKSIGKQSQRGVSDWGTPERGANEILESVLNRTKIVIKRTERLPGGGERTFTDEVATTSANEKAREMDERFSQWIWEQADRADYFLNTYNRRYNNLAKRTFNGDHLTLPGTSLRYALHAHQKTAIWRVIQTGNTYLAHAIGSGKTIESIASGMEMKRLGLIQKPMYVVPNHMLKQFSSEFMDLYPMANIMVADDENFHTTNRRRFMAQASVNKPDAVIITHSSYGLLSMKPENIQATKDIILNDLRQALEDLRAEGGARHLIRNIEQRIEQAEQRFDSIASSKKGDHVVDFEDMGVDFLFVDEAHMFRKLDFATNQQVKGIDPNGSRMALDLYLKTQYLESKTPGRSHVFMSGTPITNTMGELYTIMKYFDEGAMEKDGIRHFDAWSSMFGETRPDYEPNAAGRYELVTRFAKFNNLPELRKRVGMFMDVLTTRQLKEYVKGIPKVEGGEPKYVLALPSDELKAYQQTLQARLEQSRKWKPSPGQKGNPDPVINIITDGRLAAIDMRFVNPRLKNDPGSKLNLMIEEMVKDYKDLKNNTYLDKDGNQEPIKGGAQIVFYNHGFGAAVTSRRGFDAKGWVNSQLKKAGVPAREVAWIDDYDTAVKKEALYKEMRQGQKKILIGSAKRMGTGLNVQKRLATLQYLDAPWYPADVSQPHGRIVRQGNQNKEVNLKWYATKGTYDSTMWQMVSRKEGFIEQFFDGDDNLRSMEDISEINQYEMARALSSGDERIIKLVGLQAEEAKLSRLKEAHAQEQNQLRSEKSRLAWSIKNFTTRIADLETAYEKVGGYVRDFEAQIGNQKGITKRGDLGEAVIAAYNKASYSLTKEVETKEYGTINGFPLFAAKKFATALNVVQITPKVQYTIDEGMTYPANTDTVGLGRRILNQINKVSDELDNTKSEVEDQKKKLDQTVNRIGTPFSKERDLVEKITEIAQLQNELIKEGEAVDEGKIGEAKQKIAEEAAKKEGGKLGAADILAAGQENGEQYSISPQSLFNAQRPQGAASLVSLEDIQKAFKGQKITKTAEGYRIRTNADQFIEIKTVDHIGDDQVAFETSYGRQRAGNEVIAGSYKNGRIKLVRGVANNWVLSHESVHFMEDAGIITPGEAALLENHIRGLVKQGKFETTNPNKIGGQEDRANFIADQLTNPDPKAKGFIQKIVARIQEFIDRLGNAFGNRTVRGVTRDIETGKIFNREGFGEYNTGKSSEFGVQSKKNDLPVKAFLVKSFTDRHLLKNDPDWLAGKEKGDKAAADRFADKFWTDKKTEQFKELIGDPANTVLISMPSSSRFNLQPLALAEKISRDIPGLAVVDGQKYFRPFHEQASKHIPPIERVFNPREYEPVNKDDLRNLVGNKNVYIVDDIFTSGGSIKGFQEALHSTGIGVEGAVGYMGEARLRVDRLTHDKLVDAFRGADLPLKAGEVEKVLTKSEAGDIIRLINKARNDDEKQRLVRQMQVLLDRREGIAGNLSGISDRRTGEYAGLDRVREQPGGEFQGENIGHGSTEPGLSSGPGPSGIASPTTQEEFSNEQEERFALLKSRKDLDQSKVDAELKNYDKSSFADSMATIKDMARNWGKAQRPGRPDTSLLGRFFGSPEFTFEKVPALKKVITYNLERADLRVGKFNDLISDPAGRDLHEGLRALQKERPEEYRRLGDLLVRADQDKRTLDAEQIKKLGFSDQAVAAWADSRAIMDNGFDRQIASYQEMVRQNAAAGLPPPTIVVLDEKGQPKEVSVKTAIALMGEMRGWYWPRLRESGAYQIIAKATPEMKARGLHNRLEFKDFFVEHRAAQLRRQGYQVEYFKAKSVPEDLFAIYGKVMGTEQMINEALNRSLQAVGNKSNFQFSDMGIKAMWSTSTDEKPDFILDTKQVPQELLAKVMPIFRSLGGRWYKELKGEPKYWHFVDKGKNIETSLRRALSRYDNRLLAVEEEFARALTVNVANIEKGRGYRSSMIQRGPEVGIDVWEGSEQDPLRAMTSYASRLSAGEAKKETALKMIRAFNGTEKSWAQFKAENEEAEYSDYMKYVDTQKVSPTEQKNAYHDGLGYIQEALRNNEMADRVVGVVKGLATFKYLGFRVAAPIVNMTALITSVPAAMKGYADIPLSSTFKWLGKGADMWRQYRHPETWSTLPAETQAAFKIIQHKGWADSQYNREAMAVLKSKVGRGWNQAMDASMWMFGTTEQLNRVATLMGTFAAIREREGGSKKTGALTPEEQTVVEKAMETAKKVSDRAHGVYGPATQPASAQGGGPAAQVIKSLYMFKKFQHNYLQTMYELGWKQKDWKAATFMMAAPTLLAGSVAFPIPWALEAIMGILKHLFGVDDPEEKFYSFMEKSLGDYVGGISRQGIAGMGGKLFDLRGSLNTKVDIPTNMIELLGAPGSVFSDLYQGGANVLKGNAWKGTEKIMPRAVGTVMQGVREATEGLTTKTNAPVFFGREQIKGDFVDTILRSLSFNPARIQKMKDIEWAEKQVSQDYTQMRSGIESKFLKFYLLPEPERDKTKMVDLIDQVHQYNSKVQSHGLTGVEPMITSTSLRTYIQRNLRPSKKELVKSIKREGQ